MSVRKLIHMCVTTDQGNINFVISTYCTFMSRQYKVCMSSLPYQYDQHCWWAHCLIFTHYPWVSIAVACVREPTSPTGRKTRYCITCKAIMKYILLQILSMPNDFSSYSCISLALGLSRGLYIGICCLKEILCTTTSHTFIFIFYSRYDTYNLQFK